jgi:signal transduction histidine kinase
VCSCPIPTRPERLAAELAATQRAARQLAERNRLARELHDSVGHALTVTMLQAEAARRMLGAPGGSDPESAARALDTIAETGRTALAELDYVLGVLRDDGGWKHGPQQNTALGNGTGPGSGWREDGSATTAPVDRRARPDLSALDALVAGARSAGTDVTATVRGRLNTVPPTVSREAYRVVQEALTNALRHAAGRPVRLGVEVDDRAVTVRAGNPLPGSRPTSRRAPAAPDDRRSGGPADEPGSVPGDRQNGGPSGGRGLVGMTERVRMLGGDLAAGDRDGHWQVRATLPLDPAGEGHRG